MNANPNCVLTAVAQVTYPPGVSSLGVQIFDSLGNDAGVTPAYSTTSANPQTVPVLGLQASTPYTFAAMGWWADGGGVTSNSANFSTGALPSGLPSFVIADGGQATGQYTLVANILQNAAMGTQSLTVVDGTGHPVWYLTLPTGHALVGDFQKQPDGTYTVASYDPTHPVSGLEESPAIYRQYDVLGNEIATWSSPDQIATDDHELRLLGDGTALLYGFALQREDLVGVLDGGQADAGVYGGVMERLAPDGGVLFSWSTFNIPITDLDPGIAGYGPVVDAYHPNAIDVMADGNYLLSLRDTSELVKVDSTTGAVLWILGGLESTFTFVNDPENGFSLQHGARELPNGNLILFDDGNDHLPAYSRAVEYQLDTTANTATLVWSAQASPGLSSYALGFAQRLSNGNTLITYGTTKHVQEVAADAGLLWDLSDPTVGDFGIYRAFRLDTLY